MTSSPSQSSWPIYQVDAFADRLFQGNPAAVCPLPAGTREWPDTALLQAVALENNLSETAYFKPSADPSVSDFDLRWLTPLTEVDLCGHATLATASVLFGPLGFQGESIRFSTRSGVVRVHRDLRDGESLALDFPARECAPCAQPPAALAECLGAAPAEVLDSGHGVLVAVFDSEERVRSLRPDFARMKALGQCVLATAPGERVDFVSRYFAPHKGIDEDPVTGSAHCILTPFWSRRLDGKLRLGALQLSSRGGKLDCTLQGARVLISGRAVLYMRGEIYLPRA